MDNYNLGVNRLGRSIKKSPIHQPNFSNADTARQQPQPQPQPQPHVYNINKNDFRSMVQQLTGSPSREPLPRPPMNSPKPSSLRLQKIRPPPLAPINRPHIPIHPPTQFPPSAAANDNFMRPHPPQYGQPSPPMLPPFTAESPISAYMRYLQNSIIDSGPRQTQPQGPGPGHGHGHGHNQAHPPPSGLHPNHYVQPLLSPRMNVPPPLPSPRMNGPPPLLLSPTSQFLLQSPTAFLNLLSPRSPYPLLSPSAQHPPPLSPNFNFSPMAQPGILGPGQQFPLSPGYGFPLSPTGFFPVSSPRWRNQY